MVLEERDRCLLRQLADPAVEGVDVRQESRRRREYPRAGVDVEPAARIASRQHLARALAVDTLREARERSERGALRVGHRLVRVVQRAFLEVLGAQRGLLAGEQQQL